MQTANQTFNFDQVNAEDRPAKVLKQLYHSIRNLRKNLNADKNNKRLVVIAQQIKRTSCLAELDLYYCYALHCKQFVLIHGTPFFQLIFEYIDSFHDKEDVIKDLKPFIQLIKTLDDAKELKNRVQDKISLLEDADNDHETTPDEDFDIPEEDSRMKRVSLDVIRWKFINHKLERCLGTNNYITQENKFKLVNTLFGFFLQAMEYHQNAHSAYGAGLMHDNSNQPVPEHMLSDLDQMNAEDILIIAVETIYEVKLFDWTMVNPVNSILITMLEHGI